MPADRETRVVDLGCGHGACLYFLNRAGYQNVTGVDISTEQVEQARRLGIHGARQGSIISFLNEASPASVDVTFLLDVLEHLTSEELFVTLDAVYRILAPGGTCIVHVPNGEGLYGMRIRYGDLTHEQAFTARSMHQLFSAVGFKNIETFEDPPYVHGLKSAVRKLLWIAGTLPHRILLTPRQVSRDLL